MSNGKKIIAPKFTNELEPINNIIIAPLFPLNPVNEFMIEGRLPSLNDYTRANRAHWSKGAEYKRNVEADIIWQIRAARNKGTLRPVDKKIVLHIEWHESDQRRDVDNIVSAKKFILDAMQKAGIIPNDSRKYVAGVYDEIIDDKRDFVLVKLQEIE